MSCLNQFVKEDLAFLNGKVDVTTVFTVLHLLPSVLQALDHHHHATFTINISIQKLTLSVEVFYTQLYMVTFLAY